MKEEILFRAAVVKLLSSFGSRKLFLLLLFLMGGKITWSQAPNIAWQKALGGTGDDITGSILQTGDGGFIVAGSSTSNDGDASGSGNHGGADVWIVKLTATGTVAWQKALGGSGDDRAGSIQQTSDGGLIVAGSSTSNDGDATGNHGSSDFWVVKLDAAGTIVWQKMLGGSREEAVISIQQTSDGGYIMVGQSRSYDGDVIGNHGGSDDMWVVKLDGIGNLVWQRSLGGRGLEVPGEIQQTADGGYIVVGASPSDDGDLEGIFNHGGWDEWIVKLDRSGAIVWQKLLGGSEGDYASSVQETNDGGLIVAGRTNSDDGDVSGNHGSPDFWVVKLDNTGTIVWQKTLGGSGGEIPVAIRQTTDDGYIVVGYTRSNDGDVSGFHRVLDYWVVKLNAAGNLIWQKAMGGSYIDVAGSVLETSDGDFVVAGHTLSNDGDVVGKHSTFNDASADGWIVKLSFDVDKDGDPDNTDCAPTNADIHHGATDIPDNNIDEDCDGYDLKTWYEDKDTDGYGNPASTKTANTKPNGYVADHTDCNDNPNNGGAGVNPGVILAITAPANVQTVTSGDGKGDCTTTISLGQPTHTDNCTGPFTLTPKVGGQPITPSTYKFPTGQTTVVWELTNGTTTVSANQLVTVTDDEVPLITCPANVTTSCDKTAPASTGKATATDNCTLSSSIAITYTDVSTQLSDPAKDGYYNYVITRTWKAKDGAGKESSCVQTITVVTDIYTWYRDADGDGHGNPGDVRYSCTKPAGYVSVNNVRNFFDCDDTKNDTKDPGNNEVFMCHDGKQECVKVRDVPKKQKDGWITSTCTPPCKEAGTVLMCHTDHLHCVKQQDVQKRLKEGWTLGYCGALQTSSIVSRPINAIETAVSSSLSITASPNPFSKAITIHYTVPFMAKVSVKIYDAMGREVGQLVNSNKAAGYYTETFPAGQFAIGQYMVRLVTIVNNRQSVVTQKLVKTE